MTPLEKAKSIMRQYELMDITNPVAVAHASLIAVNEVIGQWEYVDTYLADLGGKLNPNLRYWYDVRTEIKKYT